MSIVWWIWEHIAELSTIFTIIGANGGIILWSHRRLHEDIASIKEDAKMMNARIDATGMRIDAMGTRIDNMYTVMMGLLTKKVG